MRRFEYLHLAVRGIEPAVITSLPGKPENAVIIERRRVEVYVGRALGCREDTYFVSFRIDAHDGVEARVGDPRRVVGADDHAMRARIFA